jgi:hypothetical protein
MTPVEQIQPGEITAHAAMQLAIAGQRYYDSTGSVSKLMESTVNGEPAWPIGQRLRASAAGGV